MTHLVMTGCFYDWDVGPSSAGVGSGGSSSSASGSAGAGGTDAGADCAALQVAVDAARDKAKACMFGVMGQCGASIKDERGCDSFVNDGSSADTAAFAQAVDAFVSAGCPPSALPCNVSPAMCLFAAGKPVCVP